MGSERLDVPLGLPAQFASSGEFSTQILLPLSVAQTKSESAQQSLLVLQGFPQDAHALTSIDAVKATATARMDKRIFCAKRYIRGISNDISEDGGTL
ncbi:hypothetical protein BDR04DRAFT_1090362 [Suillus decipiens]|nr:hypothetical protein BDR04DRAFT_1090362 [Suillus decipiens]